MSPEPTSPAAQSDDCSAFSDSWARLNRQFEGIPMGWQHLYGELRFRLAHITEPERCTIRIDGGWEEDGLLQIQSETTDRVVQGVLRKARLRAMNTCMQCGRPGKLRHLDDWRLATLCGTCAGPHLLALEISRVIGLERCGAINLEEELQTSPRTRLIRAAAEAAAAASDWPGALGLSALAHDAKLAWLQELKDRAQEDVAT